MRIIEAQQLVRQAYYGRKWIRENLPGCDDRVANNMDVPKRTWQMPQILARVEFLIYLLVEWERGYMIGIVLMDRKY